MIDRIGGWLEMETDPQKGNVFRIYLERVEPLSY
jgi:C4-dicarboxylate-specific signal transduction histidine kinase